MFKNHQIDNHQYWNVRHIWKKEQKFLDTWLAKFPEGANIIEQLWKINDYGQVLIISPSPECQRDKRACQRSKAILWSRLSWSRMGFLCPCRCRCSEPELMDLLQHNSQEILRTKHCQGHNGPKGWVLLAKTCLGQITSSYTNLDQISMTTLTIFLSNHSPHPKVVKGGFLTGPPLKITKYIKQHGVS